MKIIGRVKRLVTGRYDWIDTDTQEVESDHFTWRERWAMDGLHVYRWRWVQKYGAMECGCTRNPITRRFILFQINCPEGHFVLED